MATGGSTSSTRWIAVSFIRRPRPRYRLHNLNASRPHLLAPAGGPPRMFASSAGRLPVSCFELRARPQRLHGPSRIEASG
jgi:hypothetical protein